MIEYQVRVYNKRTEWCLNAQLHRLDGPAVEYVTGNRYWYEYGLLHRTTGPAVELASGTKFWYLDGKDLTEAEHAFAVAPKPTCAGKQVEIDGVKYVLTAV